MIASIVLVLVKHLLLDSVENRSSCIVVLFPLDLNRVSLKRLDRSFECLNE